MVLFAIIVLIILVALILRYEVKIGIGAFSPVFLLGVPTTVVISLFYVIRPYIQYRPLSGMAIWLIIVGILIFWMGGMSCRQLRLEKRLINKSIYKPSKIKPYFLIITLVCVAGMVADLNSILGLHRHVLQLEDQEFANNGLSAHMGNWLSICIIYYMGAIMDSDMGLKKKYACLLLLPCLFLKFLTAVKGELILPIIGGGIFIYLIGKLRVNIKTIAIGIALIAVLFITMGRAFNSDVVDVVDIYFFTFYLFAGITGLSGLTMLQDLQWGLYPHWIVRFFINFYEKFFGEGILNTDSGGRWVECALDGASGPKWTNVATLEGEIFLNCGFLFGTIVLFILGWYSYYLFYHRRYGAIYKILYSYVGACLFLNFFSTYIIQPGFYECQFVCLIVIFLLKINSAKRL